MAITRKKLTEVIKNNVEVSDALADKIIRDIFDYIKSEVSKGEKMEIRGFGSITPMMSNRTKARNISKREEISIPPTVKPKFRPSKDFVRICNVK